MKISLKLLLAPEATAMAAVVSSEPVFARGGGAGNILNSPGYQRRLQESRQQLSQPGVQPSATHRREGRHRHRNSLALRTSRLKRLERVKGIEPSYSA